MREFSYGSNLSGHLSKGKKIMSKTSATTSKKSKSSTANSSLDQISEVLVDEFSKVIGGSLPAEFKVFEKAVKMIEAKKVGYRGIAKSIEKANEVGALPTIKPSHAQDFVSASKIRTLEGGATQSLKVLLNTAIQARKYFNGKDGKMPLAEALDFVASFEDLKASIPSQGEQAKRKARTEGDKVEKAPTLEQIIKALGSALKAKPVLKGQAIKDAEAVAFLLAQTLERSKTSLKIVA
jgi:hypothetical protein